MITQYNDDEDYALQGLPLRAQVIYLRGLRRFMDFRTGLVGRVRRVSYVSLAEVCQEEVNRALQTKATKSSVRCSLDQLARAGLIERIGAGDHLVFRMLLADTDKSVQNNHSTTTAHLQHTNHSTDKPSNDAACRDYHDTTTAQPQHGNRSTHPISVININKTQTIHSARARVDGVSNVDKSQIQPAGVDALSPVIVCREVMQLGLIGVNPALPRLLEALEAGAVIDDFVYAARDALAQGKGFAWVCGVVCNRLRERTAGKPADTGAKSVGGFSEREIRDAARPGESREQVISRLSAKREGQRQQRRDGGMVAVGSLLGGAMGGHA